MVNIVEMLLTNHNRPKKKLIKLKGLVIHYTANTNKGANAVANRNYFNNTTNSCSAHYIIDDKQIIRCVPDSEVAYHCGANKYTTLGTSLREGTAYSPNFFTVGVEMCVNSDGDWNKTYQNTVEFVAKFLKEHGLTIDNLLRHYDITGKNCPAMMIDEKEWRKFKQAVQNEINKQLIQEVFELFKDEKDISTWAKDSVKRVSDLGLIKGNELGEFKPKNGITREEFAVVLDRLLKYLGK